MSGLLACNPAGAQSISLEARNAGLREVVEKLEPRTGYAFRVSVGPPTDALRRDFRWQETPLSRVLAELSAAYSCEFYSADATGFFVIPARAGGTPETAAGPYRLRPGPIVPEGDPGVLRMTLRVSGRDQRSLEAVAGLAPDLKVIDNFGRVLAPPTAPAVRSTSAFRSRLTEYSQDLPLALPDRRSARIRSIEGALVLYRRVEPLRFEFPLDPTAAAAPQELSQSAVEIRVESVTQQGDQVRLATRLAWPAGRDVVGEGISRAPVPYLVDANGRVYRDFAPVRLRRRVENGEQVSEQHLRFQEVAARPARLVYEILVREHPAELLPFRLAGIPLPGQDEEPEKVRQRPYHATGGGSLLFVVTDSAGSPVEGEVAVGLARKTGDGWDGTRWLEVLTDPEGRVRLGPLRPGEYRLVRIFRFDPLRPPVPGPYPPVEARVEAGREAVAPGLRLSVPAPRQP